MSVFLNNLDDFIAPSQACINPLVLNKPKPTATSSDTNTTSSSAKIVLQTDFSVSEFDGLVGSKRQILPHAQAPDLIKTKMGTQNQKVASVSLNDCLACRFVFLFLLPAPSSWSKQFSIRPSFLCFILPSFTFLSASHVLCPYPDSIDFHSLVPLSYPPLLVFFSGCVTSAETVLIQEQSYEKLLTRLLSLPSAITALPTTTTNSNGHQQPSFHEGGEIIVVCLSPQSVAAIAQLLSITGGEQPAGATVEGASSTTTTAPSSSSTSSSSNDGISTSVSPCITAAQVFLQVAGVLKRAGYPQLVAFYE